VLLSVAFLIYESARIPRLGNNHFGDIEFSGWSGPMGSRLLRGERPYIDFILPIPPGSFAILAALELLVGALRLKTELWLDATLNLGMVWLAYAMARPFTASRNALLVAFCTLIALTYLNKECAYDHTAQLAAWGSFALGIRAFFAEGAHRRRAWFWAGFLAAFTLFFKQSTALGALVGWSVCFGYLCLVEWRSGHSGRVRALFTDVASLGRGAFTGLWVTWGGLVALGTTASAFFQASFLDASKLKGGLWLLLKNVFVYLFVYPAYPGSLFVLAGFALVLFRLVKRRGGLSIGDEPSRPSPTSLLDRLLIPVACAASFGGAAALLGFGPSEYPIEWVLELDRVKQVPTFALVATAIFFVAHLVRTPPPDPETTAPDPVRVGHILNALWLATLVCTILHNTSAPEFRPYYDNDPIIPLSLLSLLVMLDRAGARWLQGVFVLALIASLGGNRLYRSMTATTDAPSGTYWAGMKLSQRGVVMEDVAARVRELTQPDDTVLVLPEDVGLATQIGRPRPNLRGAIVFVDQYAPRLVDDDIAELEAHPPKVLVLHPRSVLEWQRFFRIWSGDSGAEQILQHTLRYMIPARYRRDRSYPTSFLWKPAKLDIYVRVDGPEDLESDETSDGELDQDAP
jgi:hypothetical protein